MLIRFVICVCKTELEICRPRTSPLATARRMVWFAVMSILTSWREAAKFESEDFDSGNTSGLSPLVKVPKHSR